MEIGWDLLWVPVVDKKTNEGESKQMLTTCLTNSFLHWQEKKKTHSIFIYFFIFLESLKSRRPLCLLVYFIDKTRQPGEGKQHVQVHLGDRHGDISSDRRSPSCLSRAEPQTFCSLSHA